MVNHPGQQISQYDLAALFGAAFVQSATVEKALNGFSAPGIWPCNPKKISPERCVAAKVSDEPPPPLVNHPLLLTCILQHLATSTTTSLSTQNIVQV